MLSLLKLHFWGEGRGAVLDCKLGSEEVEDRIAYFSLSP